MAPPFVGTIVNSVFVDPINTIFEADETNNGAVQATTVNTGVDLMLVKDDTAPRSPEGFDPIATSGTQTYIITIDNIGPQSVSNVRVRDVLPAGTTFRSAQGTSGFTCSHASGIVDCVGALHAGHVRGVLRGCRRAQGDDHDQDLRAEHRRHDAQRSAGRSGQPDRRDQRD